MKNKYLFDWPHFNSNGKIPICHPADFPQFSLARIVSYELPKPISGEENDITIVSLD